MNNIKVEGAIYLHGSISDTSFEVANIYYGIVTSEHQSHQFDP